MTTIEREAIVENALNLAFNNPALVNVDGDLSRLCDQGCEVMRAAIAAVDALQASRELLIALMKQIKDADAPMQAKLSIVEAWTPVSLHLDMACESLGRNL